jgi:hypothetical protein
MFLINCSIQITGVAQSIFSKRHVLMASGYLILPPTDFRRSCLIREQYEAVKQAKDMKQCKHATIHVIRMEHVSGCVETRSYLSISILYTVREVLMSLLGIKHARVDFC